MVVPSFLSLERVLKRFPLQHRRHFCDLRASVYEGDPCVGPTRPHGEEDTEGDGNTAMNPVDGGRRTSESAVND